MEAIEALRQNYPTVPAAHFIQAPVEQMPFADGFFDHIISSAVLHFADSHAHFEAMFGEMVRVLKPGGSLFIRMTTDEGLETPGADLGDGRYFLGDGSERYLLSRERLDQLILDYSLEWLEPFKTVVVERVRSMAVIMLSKR